MHTLFNEIRENSSSEIWSKAVRLSRSGSILFDKKEEGGFIFQTIGESKISNKVTLWLEDSEWHCDCRSQDDPCHHVAGAIILLKQHDYNPQKLPKANNTANIHHKLVTINNEIKLERFIKTDNYSQKLTSSLASLTNSNVNVTITRDDLYLEYSLKENIYGNIEKFIVKKIFRILSNYKELTLDEEKIFVNPTPIGTIAIIKNHLDGVMIIGKFPENIDKIYSNGIVKIADTLHPLSDSKLTPQEKEMLLKGKSFLPNDYANLVSVIIPNLEKKIQVHINSDRLPSKIRVLPRSVIKTIKNSETLKVISYIAYGDPIIARIQEGQVIAVGDKTPLRDIEKENFLKRKFYKNFGFELGKTELFHRSNAVLFAKKLKDQHITIEGDAHKHFELAPPLTPIFSENNGTFTLDFISDGKKSSEGISRIFEAWKNSENLVPLIGGGYAQIPTIWLMRYGNEILELLSMKNKDGQIPKAAYPFLANITEKMGLNPSEVLKTYRDKLENFDKIPSLNISKKLNKILRPYQKTGVNFLSFLKSHSLGAMLADDMGLGKTLQALSVLNGKTLVVAPTSVTFNWINEIKKFRPELKANLYHGKDRKLKSSDITITTYAILRIDIEEIRKKKWDNVILDEAQFIKNPKSQAAQAAYSIEADFKLVMTGTPVENSLEDLWSQFNFINPGLLGDLKFFNENIVKPIINGDETAAERLRVKIKPFVLRRLKKEVAKELPPKTETILYAELSKKERNLYDMISAATRKDVLNKLDSGGNVMDALEALLRLRQACTHPSLIPGRYAKSSSKLDLLIEYLQKIIDENHKAVIFSQWTSFLDIIEKSLQSNGIKFLRLDGSTRDRSSVIESFQNDDGPPVLIMSLKAGGVGINITAADNVFIMDPWWNPAAEEQAADRAYRIGQTKPVIVHKVITLGTVEEKIIKLQQHKKKLSNSIISKESLSRGITKQDIINLLKS